MFASFDNTTLIFFALALLAGTYFLAAATDSVIGSDGFGTIRNMIILIAGAGLGLFVQEHLRLEASNPVVRSLFCLFGAFACLALLAFLKRFANRLHY